MLACSDGYWHWDSKFHDLMVYDAQTCILYIRRCSFCKHVRLQQILPRQRLPLQNMLDAALQLSGIDKRAVLIPISSAATSRDSVKRTSSVAS